MKVRRTRGVERGVCAEGRRGGGGWGGLRIPRLVSFWPKYKTRIFSSCKN